MSAPEITDVVLDQWEDSANQDRAAGRLWSVNPVAVLAVVAEVRRLRETLAMANHAVEHGAALTAGQKRLTDKAEAERDAARAEAERQRERADHNAAAVNENADEIVRLRAELDRFKPQPMSQQCRDGRHGQTGDWRCHNCRCLCHTFEHSRAGHDPVCEALQREYDRTMGDLAVAVAEAGRVREALQAVRELHHRSVDATGLVYCDWCDENVKGYGQGELWPCETVAVLDAALDGETPKCTCGGRPDEIGGAEHRLGCAALGGEQPSKWRRNPACIERWPDCADGEYNPACCRFPKACSCDEPADAALDGAE